MAPPPALARGLRDRSTNKSSSHGDQRGYSESTPQRQGNDGNRVSFAERSQSPNAATQHTKPGLISLVPTLWRTVRDIPQSVLEVLRRQD